MRIQKVWNKLWVKEIGSYEKQLKTATEKADEANVVHLHVIK